MTQQFQELASRLAEIGRQFYARGWVFGTSGNFSARLSAEPLHLAITSSGLDKGELSENHIVIINDQAKIISDHPNSKPSDESLLHVQVVRLRGAGAVLHTHSVWSTILSDLHAEQGGLMIEGFEMLKGLQGVKTHQHREWLPILENGQNMVEVAQQAAEILQNHPEVHGFLLRGHGLYTWGETLSQAKRHIEIFEFLLEATGRKRSLMPFSTSTRT